MNKLLTCVVFVMISILSACVPGLASGATLSPSALPQPSGVLTASKEPAPPISPASTLPSPTSSPSATTTVSAPALPSATATPTGTPTHTPAYTPTRTPTVQPTSSATPWPTPDKLPPAPRGWRWQLHASNIPVTHYIIHELSPDDASETMELPYGLDDQPLAGTETLPRTFLLESAYQGSGRLPNGDILQYAATRPPVERGLVPFRFVVTPAERCAGHPLAGNGTCSVPMETAATTMREGEEPLVPVGSTIFIPELDMKIRINDIALSDGPPKVDLYTGTVNNYDHERPDGATIWILTEE